MKKLGILGGGQLGRMMMPSIRSFGIHVSVLDPNPQAPCANLADNFVIGNFNNYDDVLAFGKTVDILTIEIEHVNIEALETLEKEGIIVRPSSNVLRKIQDKLIQKQFFANNKIPTSDFIKITNKENLLSHLEFLPAVQKTRTGGYDGQGVQILKIESDLQNGFEVPSLLEKLVSIDQELSVIVSRNANGDIQTFPTVGQDFDSELNLVKFVYAPAQIDAKIDNTCQKIAKEIATKIELEGILAVEFFLDTDGKILVNEMAPRCHNSGHWSIEGAITSQFEQLVRAVMNWPLGATETISPSVMINILGAADHTGTATIKGLKKVLETTDAHFHWYGKNTTKPGRKMGHATILNKNLDQAKKIGERLLEQIKIVSE